MGSVKYQLLLCTLPGEQPLPGTITARGLRLELIGGSYKNPISDVLPCAAAAKKGGGGEKRRGGAAPSSGKNGAIQMCNTFYH
jgi:hypothetical protein